MIKYDPWQADFLACKGDKILCTGRQVGKSEVCAADAVEYAVNNPKSKPIVMIAPLEKQAYALFSKALAYLQAHYPNLICKKKDKPTQTRIKLVTGVEIYCLPVGANGLNIRFLTIGRLYMDEASRVPEEVFVAVQPALLTTGGDTILLSTLNGAQGTFYDCWINKDDAYKSFTRFAVNTEDVVNNREICATWTEKQRAGAIEKLEQAKSRMSQAEYGQEYLGIAMLNMSRFFSDELIEKTCVLERRGFVAQDRKYYLGCDVSAMGEDETVVSIVEKSEGEIINQVESIITQRVYTTQTSENIVFLHDKYRFKGIGIDDNGVGFGVFSELLREKSTKRVTVSLNNESRELDDEGEKSKRILKEEMYFRLLAWMEKGRIKLLNDKEIKESLKSIQFKLELKPGQPTRHVISGNYSHCAESIIRAVWLAIEDKTLDLWVR